MCSAAGLVWRPRRTPVRNVPSTVTTVRSAPVSSIDTVASTRSTAARIDRCFGWHRDGEQGGERRGGGCPAGDDQIAALEAQRSAVAGDLGAEQSRGFERRFQAGPRLVVDVVGEVDELGEAKAGPLGLPGQRRRVGELARGELGDVRRGVVDSGLLALSPGCERGVLAPVVVDGGVSRRAEDREDPVALVGERRCRPVEVDTARRFEPVLADEVVELGGPCRAA